VRNPGLGKLLAYVLRHRPDAAGVALDAAGWVDVDELVAGLRRGGRRVTADDVRKAVDADGKGRYELADGRIRAAQGHSVGVELGLEPVAPPAVLYHGTVERFLPSILATGLRPGSGSSCTSASTWPPHSWSGGAAARPSSSWWTPPARTRRGTPSAGRRTASG